MGRPQEYDNYSQSKQYAQAGPSDELKKRRKIENCVGTESDWEYLIGHLNSGASKFTYGDQQKQKPTNKNNLNAILFPYIPLIFNTLHLFYEDMKINSMMKTHLSSLAEVISFINFKIYTFS